MADSAGLQQIVNDAREAGWTPNAWIAALNKLAHSNIKALVMSVSRTRELLAGGEASKALGGVFLLARAAVERGTGHEFLQDLAELARDLGAAKLFLPEALGFLSAIIDRQAKTSQAARQRRSAIDALLAGITPDNPGLQAFMMVLSVLMPVLEADDRQRFIDEMRDLPEGSSRDPLAPSLRRYHDLLKRAEAALSHDTRTAPEFSSVISIHSHKGGVGKTTLGISLALALAQEGKRVCLVDCDEQGPSLHYYLPVGADTQRDVQFFSDWFCSGEAVLPEGLIKPVAGFGGRVHCIAGSFIGVDISYLDSYQTKARTENPEKVRDRLAHLVHILLTDKAFDSVVLDTSPGLLHLSLDVLMACLKANGSRVFVMSPRPIDIAQFCIEEDWIVRLLSRSPSDAIVVNRIPASEHPLSKVDFTDSEAILRELSSWPQFQAYNTRFMTEDMTEALKGLVRTTWSRCGVVQLPESKALRHAGTIRFRPTESVAQVLGNDGQVMEGAERILMEFKKQWKRRGEPLQLPADRSPQG